MNTIIILFIVALVFSSVGWNKFLYFISIGYGFSVAACAVTIAIVHFHSMTLPGAILCGILFIYGLRLGGYLLLRELRSSSYNKVIKDITGEDNYPFVASFCIWIACAVLYVGEVSPVAFILDNAKAGLPVNWGWAWAGIIVMLSGVALESAADAQKSAAKKVNPHRFVDTGLYKIVRCPNYFGEVVMWTGCFIICFGACCNVWQWILAAVGYISIVYIMFSGARRLEVRQNKNYGSDPEYQAYVKKTPILIPLIPLYSVEKYTWLKG